MRRFLILVTFVLTVSGWLHRVTEAESLWRFRRTWNTSSLLSVEHPQRSIAAIWPQP